MSLENQIKSISDDFEHASPEQIVEVLNQIKPFFKSSLISEYLQGKIQKISECGDVGERKKLCKALMPYFDWYLQGQ